MGLVIKAEDVSKKYRLGVLNSGSLKQDLNQSLQGFLRSTAPSYDRESDDGHIWALKDVNFCIEQGETLGFVGRNGAGKSTLLKILSRITLPTTGTIKGIGRISSLLEVGTGFHPELTGRENVFLNGHILGMKRSEILRKFDEIVGFSGVEKFIDTPVKRYSSGMYVRLSFAVAAHMDPDILIIDEALAVGDAEFQTRCLDKMRTISTGEGRTVIFVSHNMQAVRQLCKRAIYLDHGTIAADGAPEQVIANYLTRENVECLKVEFPTPEVARGNKEIRFKYAAISILSSDNGSIDTQAALRVDFEFWQFLQPESALVVGIHVCDFSGTCLFDLNSESKSARETLMAGFFNIPADFLTAGSYYIGFDFIRNGNESVFNYEVCLSFDVKKGQSDTVFFDKWNGLVKPGFPVTLTYQ
jgi:lipopolysaccharide transport system ATP-binding protein